MPDKDKNREDSSSTVKKHGVMHYIKYHKVCSLMVLLAAGLVCTGISLFFQICAYNYYLCL